MIISKHAISRSKQRGLVPKSAKAPKVKNYIKNSIKKRCESIHYNPATGAKIFVTDEFVAITKRGTVLTIYPIDRNDCINA